MRPDDLALLSVPNSPTLHGDLLLVGVSSPDTEENRYRTTVRRVPLDGGEPRPWTTGERDGSPVLSPDGRLLAFLRPGGERDTPQLHVMPVDGGEPRRLTDLPLGAGRPVWAPNSRQLAFTARVAEPGRYGTPAEDGTAGPAADAEAPRRITRMDYLSEGDGYVHDRHSRLFVLDATAPGTAPVEPTELTDGRCSVSYPAWTPDGAHLIVVTGRDLGAKETTLEDLYAVPVAGGEPVLIAHTCGWAQWPVVTEDGLVVYFGDDRVSDGDKARSDANNVGLWAVLFRLDEPGVPHRLTDVESVDCETATGPAVVRRGELLVAVLNRGAVELRTVPTDAANLTLAELPVVLGGQVSVRAYTADPDRVVAVVSTPDSPGEVVLIADGQQHPLTHFAEPLQAAGLRPVEELTGVAADGYPVHGWLVRPAGDGPHPVLLCVHGGPFAAYGWNFFDEAQVYAAAGYAVVLPNPRGSASYGQAHGRSIVHAIATVDVVDVLALLDVALARADCDADRVGVMGGSYGGFMTSWLASHHGERFTAAWSERAVNAWDSFAGTSDIGWEFAEGFIGSDPATQRAVSPVYYADQISIPFAVVHSEGDLRCPFEQAQRMFFALRSNGVEAELLVFPGEGHELTRSGQPRHRLQRFRAVLEWWGRHLPAA